MRNTKIKWITEFGVLLALFYVLDFISRLLPTITMVNGSVALSAVPTLMVFVGIKYGPLKGLLFGMMAPMTLYIGIYPPFFENPAQFY